MMKRRIVSGHPAGFTLIELMIVIGIILIIATMTLSALHYVQNADRVGSEAARVQSFIMGARDRAIYADELRGVRLYVEPTPPGSDLDDTWTYRRTVTSMAYIAPGGSWNSPEHSSGIQILRRYDIDGNGNFTGPLEDLGLRYVRGFNDPGWWNLKRRGWLVDGLRIRIPAGPTGHWYGVDTRLINTTAAPTYEQVLLLQIDYSDKGNPNDDVAWDNLTYEIEFPAQVLPQEPLLLSDGVVIDLDGSRIPNAWEVALPSGGTEFSGYMDIWFSPRGNVVGDAAAAGLMHFYVCDREDSYKLKEAWVATGNPPPHPFVPIDEIDSSTQAWVSAHTEGVFVPRDRRIVSLFSQTGAVSVNPVNGLYDGDGTASSPIDGIAGDPFRFAETGEAAK